MVHRTRYCLLASAAFGLATLLGVPAWSAEPVAAVLAQPSVSPAAPSLTRSGVRTFTYEVGNGLDNFIFMSAASGGLGAGVLLTGFNTLQSWTVYTVNDYIWQTLYTPDVGKDGPASFDMQQSFWHTTLKYMTGKPIVASIKIAAIYVYTGSAATALVYGTAATAGASVIFFANNLAWDFYEHWSAAPAPGADPQALPPVIRLTEK